MLVFFGSQPSPRRRGRMNGVSTVVITGEESSILRRDEEEERV
jgi:hypothetical protein